jgi:hypothetical protein
LYTESFVVPFKELLVQCRMTTACCDDAADEGCVRALEAHHQMRETSKWEGECVYVERIGGPQDRVSLVVDFLAYAQDGGIYSEAVTDGSFVVTQSDKSFWVAEELFVDTDAQFSGKV